MREFENLNLTHVCFRYMKGHDPADWVIVDAETGKVTTSKALDRESVFVNQSIYNVTIYAVDSGMTCFFCLFVCLFIWLFS